MSVNVRGGALEFDAVINNTQFKRQIDEIEAKLKGLTTTAEKEAKAIDNLVNKTAVAIAGYASFAAATDFISQIVQVRGEFQQLEVAFRTMLKNKAAADLLMAQAVDLAARTPFTLQNVGQGAKQLLAYGFAASDITKNIEKLGNVASGVGAPLNDIIYLYGTLKTQGQAYNRDILQFTSRGIPIIAELAKQFGVSEKEVKKLVEAGKVGFPEIEAAFTSMTSESGIFFNLMQEQSKTLTGLLSNLQDAWSRMLNDIGKNNEGTFTTAISGAIDLVNNYEKVVDILKILVVTYGSYRAALLLTSAATSIATNVARGYTVAQTLQYQAMLLSERAMKLLNAAMLTNPFILAATAIGALVAAMIVFKKETTATRSASELLAASQKKSAEALSEQEVKIRAYIAQVKAGNLSEKQRIEIYEKLKAIDPSIVKGLTDKTISYQNLTKNVEEYLSALRKKINLEANQDALTESIKAEEAIKKQIANSKELAKFQASQRGSGTNANQFAPGLQGFAEDRANVLTKKLEAELKQQQKVSEELATSVNQTIVAGEEKVQDSKKRTISVIEDEIKALKEQQSATATSRQDFLKSQGQIIKLEKELEAIIGKKTSKEVKQANEDLKALLETVSQAEEDARASGLVKQEAELKKIENRFNDLRKKAQELGAGNGILQRIERASDISTGNQQQKQDFEDYKKYVSEQQEVFTRFEEFKFKFGKQKAEELTQYQTGSFQDYLDFLQVQLALIKDDNTLKGKLKKEFLATAITDAEKEKTKLGVDQQIENLKRVVDATVTFNIQRLKIEENFQNDLETLRKNYSGGELDEREAALKQNRDTELSDLQSSAARSSDVYKKLNEDILLYTRQQLIARRRELVAYLEKTPGLSPQIRADIKRYLDELNGIIKESTKFSEYTSNFEDAAQALGGVSSGFGQLAQATEGINDDLSEMLQTLSDITGVASNVAAALANFASGNIIGGIAASISAIIGVVKAFSAAKKSQQKAQEQLQAFQIRYLSGEIEINQIYRQRQQEQSRLNKLKLDGLAIERQTLNAQKTANQSEFEKTLKRLQQESYIIGQREEKYGGFLGIARKTRVVDITKTLAGKSFDELEKLFTQGQLKGQALDLFNILQKIKNEGGDIDKILADNAAEAKQLFTGTTADSITDSIVDGFSNGLRSASDFADSFEGLMKQSILNALKFQALEGPLKEFYDQFAKNAESDGILTAEEIVALRENFNGIISNAGKKFDELQKITDINFDAKAGTGGSGLSGAIRGITEQQADLLAGQFGGLRLTAVDQLRVSQQGLASLQRIEIYTSNLVAVKGVLERLELNGIKVK